MTAHKRTNEKWEREQESKKAHNTKSTWLTLKIKIRDNCESPFQVYVREICSHTSPIPLCMHIVIQWIRFVLMFRQLELTRAHTLTPSQRRPHKMPAVDVIFVLHTFGAHMLRSIPISSLSHPPLPTALHHVLLNGVTKFNVNWFGLVLRIFCIYSSLFDILFSRGNIKYFMENYD